MGPLRPAILLFLCTSLGVARPAAERRSFVYVPATADDSITVLVATPGQRALAHAGTVRHPEGTRAPLDVLVHPSGEFAYVVHAGDRTSVPGVSLHRVDPCSGRLEFRAMLARSLGALHVALSDDGQRAWLADAESRTLRSFVIEPSLGLWREDHAAMPTGADPIQIVSDPGGRFLFVLNRESCSVSRYRIDELGRAHVAGEEVLLNGSEPVEACLDPTGSRFFVSLATWDLVLSMSVDPHHAGLRTINAAATGEEPRGICYSDQHDRVYVAEAGSGSLSAWDVDAETGRLGARLGPYAAGDEPRHVALAPDGEHLWLTGAEPRVQVFGLAGRTAAELRHDCGLPGAGRRAAGSGAEAVVRVDTLGLCVADVEGRTLRLLPDRAGTSAQLRALDLAPNQLAVDPFGRWVIVLQERPGLMSVVPVSPAGRLGAPFETVQVSRVLADIAVEPGGRFVAVASRTPPLLWIYRVDPTSRTLEVSHELRLGATPDSLAWDPAGRFICVTHRGANRVTIARVEDGSFLGPAVTADVRGGPGAIAVSRRGLFAYVALTHDHAVLPLSIDVAAARLTPVPALSVGTPGAPERLVLDRGRGILYAAAIAADGAGTLCVIERHPSTDVLRIVREERVQEAALRVAPGRRARALAAAATAGDLVDLGVLSVPPELAGRPLDPRALRRVAWLERFAPLSGAPSLDPGPAAALAAPEAAPGEAAPVERPGVR